MKTEIYEPLGEKIRELLPKLKEVREIVVYQGDIQDIYYGEASASSLEVIDEITSVNLEDVLESIEEFIRKGMYDPEKWDRNRDDFIDDWEYGKPLQEQSDELGDFLTNILL